MPQLLLLNVRDCQSRKKTFLFCQNSLFEKYLFSKKMKQTSVGISLLYRAIQKCDAVAFFLTKWSKKIVHFVFVFANMSN